MREIDGLSHFLHEKLATTHPRHIVRGGCAGNSLFFAYYRRILTYV
jgi:hypothetical protein